MGYSTVACSKTYNNMVLTLLSNNSAGPKVSTAVAEDVGHQLVMTKNRLTSLQKNITNMKTED